MLDRIFKRVLLTQLEVKLETTVEALRLGKQHGLTTILNTAPALHLPQDVYPHVDILCANETELETLSGRNVASVEEATLASRILIGFGAKQVLVTLGSKGCLLVNSDNTVYKEALAVKAIDSTGAGDCFLGAFAYYLASGMDIDICMEKANVAAAYSVQREGTQTSFPTMAQLSSS